MKYREYVFEKVNNYLFGNPATQLPIMGYEVLRKYATMSKAKNPHALTSTRLRKHLATLTQLFNMTENDMEQLASFMGHTLGIHRSSYRLPNDVYQTAKISKLLILMEKGNAGQFRGKSLDEIELDLEEALDVEQPNDDVLQMRNEMDQEQEEDEIGVSEPSSIKEVPKKKNIREKRVLIPWTDQQKKVVTTYFRSHIASSRPPKKSECYDLISKYPDILKNKNWLKIKVFVQNKYRLVKK